MSVKILIGRSFGRNRRCGCGCSRSVVVMVVVFRDVGDGGDRSGVG